MRKDCPSETIETAGKVSLLTYIVKFDDPKHKLGSESPPHNYNNLLTALSRASGEESEYSLEPKPSTPEDFICMLKGLISKNMKTKPSIFMQE